MISRELAMGPSKSALIATTTAKPGKILSALFAMNEGKCGVEAQLDEIR
ncbi:protein of unknown function [Candidatus Nitrotoga arctica]|uniref:Uncharacterized protein n=1 Tax=Candidatus Nitrotoga arctica TaxID=453162 RepID=A0ABM8YWM4_9PROT|nr:protein of unknown function [Candidatus Nitrotoga arctica]